MNTRTRIVPLAFVLAALGLVLGAAPSVGATAGLRARLAVPAWAPAATAAIHPGVQTITYDTTTPDPTDGGQCTSNFIFRDGAGVVYIGQAAHCAGLGVATDTNGCTSLSLPLGTPVEVEGADHLGTLVYSSWLTMQALGETDAETCDYNDLALVRLDPADVAKVNPSVPHWGGPTAVGGATAEGDDIYTYGNSSLRLGFTPLSPKIGYSLGTTPQGWSHTVYTVTPGIPGDSGSGFMDAQGRAFGVLSTVAILPLPASNGVGDLAHELGYLAAHGGPAGTSLVPGTEPFTPGLPL
jgi:hypothetical protein